MFFDPPHDSPLSTSVPCIVEMSIGAGAEVRHYGPFASLTDAREWCANQTHNNFTILPLRRTDKIRSHSDWYNPQHHDIEILVDDFYDIDKFNEWRNAQ